MQTFLPYPDFAKSAQSLDYRRLGKQRVEAMQMINILTGKHNEKNKHIMLDIFSTLDSKKGKSSWANHPAVLMWKGHENALKHYFNVISLEWIGRGYKHNMGFIDINESFDFPKWIGDERFHLAHQSNLIRKKPEYYGPMFPGVPDDLEYVWPSKAIMVG